ncbi:hypothetical protein F5Y19DRAFT_490680 [Xylariaceae sp. FL1651]|nr:hypothetical protein F5Y19DRAFT_490680 [Xylariaceae sp. FL1651]
MGQPMRQAKKRARTTDSLVSTKRPRLKSPLPRFYSEEGKGAAALTGFITSLPSTMTVENATPVSEVSHRLSSTISLGLPICDPNTITTSTRRTGEDGAHTVISSPNAELVVVSQGSTDGVSPKHPLEDLHANYPGPFVRHLTLPYAHVHDPPTRLVNTFFLGSEVTDYPPGTASPGFGVANSLESRLFGYPVYPALIHGKLRILADNTAESRLTLPALHSPTELSSTDDLSSNNLYVPSCRQPCNEEASTSLISPIPTPSSSYSIPTLISTLRFENDFEPSVDFADASPTSLEGPADTKPERRQRRRGQLLPKEREETSKTRRWKACIRCRMQKIRCVPGPGNPGKEYCLCCSKVLVLETKKVIHRIPCLRWNINEAAFSRVGGLELTKQWAGVRVENIASDDWDGSQIYTIEIGISLLPNSLIKAKVRRFKPKDTDVLERCWTKKKQKFRIRLPAYALTDVNNTTEEYQRCIEAYATEAIRRYAEDTRVHLVVGKTFSAALNHASKKSHASATRTNPTGLFHKYFQLWFATRLTLGSAYIARGYEELYENQKDVVLDRRYENQVSVPRMITAQFDSIGYKHVLVKLKRDVLEDLWVMMQKRSSETFFTVYLIVFMMLDEVSVACRDRRRRARDHGLTTKYDLEDATAKIKHGTNIILGHWHYYKGDLDPLSLSPSGIARAFGDDVGGEIQLLLTTCNAYEHMKRESKDMDWEDDLYIVSQMFEKGWGPRQTCGS